MRPTRDQALMSTAFVWANRSTCSRRNVGAVVSRAGRILVQGYNGAPRGVDHCRHDDDNPCTISVHAEANAIAFAAREGVSLLGTELHTTDEPCLNCAMLTLNAGISRVVYYHNYRLHQGLELLASSGIEIMRFNSPDDKITP
jgi:dCMP deaminase